jgi:acetoin utilization deacetylase AcuC-like enzyme
MCPAASRRSGRACGGASGEPSPDVGGSSVSELLMVEQRLGRRDAAPWVLEGGRRLPGHDDNRRLAALRRGLLRHPGVRAIPADAGSEEVELTLSALHEPAYLQALREVCSDEPVVLPELAPPGLPLDIPVRAGLVAAAHEAVRTGITAARRLAAGARFTYALCRPPGHHAGPGWLAGYCYLNTAAAAVWTLRESGVSPVGVLDLDLHYPNGTAAILAPLADAHLHSLHASPVTNVPALTVSPRNAREHVVELAGDPSAEVYLGAVAASIDTLAQSCRALVVSLGYDTVAGDPHGSWSLPPAVFAPIGRLLAASGLPVCVIQEGGYALHTLASCSDAFATGLLEAGGVRGRERAWSARRHVVTARRAGSARLEGLRA